MHVAEEKVKQLASEQFNISVGQITSEMVLRDLDGYDSLSVLLFMLALEERLGIKIEASRVREWRTYQDIENTVNAQM